MGPGIAELTENGAAGRDTFLDFGGNGPTLLFLHANGFPPACYRALLTELASTHHVLAAPMRPLWPRTDPARLRDWSIFSADLERSMQEQLTGATVVAGHSLGATVALRAALRSSARFSALILIDPVISRGPAMLLRAGARGLGLTPVLNPLARGARRRRVSFRSLDSVFKSYRERAVFRRFGDDNLRACIAGLVRPAKEGGYRLLYPPAWEARVYESAVWNDWDLWRGISQLGVRTLIIRGKESDTFRGATARAIAGRNPGIRITEVQRATHLVPLERPRETARACKEFLQSGKAGRRERRIRNGDKVP